MIAALFVQADGVYSRHPDVDPWDEKRDARKYNGPWSVIAHPPCARWGRYWFGSPSSPKRLKRGDDGGCFDAALSAVEKWGGVLEHPMDSSAWDAFGVERPPAVGGWIRTRRGWTCCVAQGKYGHRAQKMTWLYYVGDRHPPELRWGTVRKRTPLENLSKRARAATPIAFRNLLISIVREGAT